MGNTVSDKSAVESARPRVLLVTNELQANPAGGRELLCKLNHDTLKEIFGNHLVVLELPRSQLQGFKLVAGGFSGYIDGLSEKSIAQGLQLIEIARVGKIFVDGSNLGAFVKAVKRRFPTVMATTFCHNVETRFFLGSLKQNKSAHALAVLIVNYLAERKAVRYSDKLVCLSERDSRLFRKVYGRSATHVSSMALEDKMPVGFALNAKPPKERFALFVGGTFYANRAGISWFVKHVVPRIHIKVCIVGRGFESFRQELAIDRKVEVVGAVEQLSDWYRDAHYVIAPIFDGSGMKTKVAEALMYGKKIIGTPEAFSGYEDIADVAGRICNSVDDFVDACNSADEIIESSFDNELRKIYEKKYSLQAARARIENILNT